MENKNKKNEFSEFKVSYGLISVIFYIALIVCIGLLLYQKAELQEEYDKYKSIASARVATLNSKIAQFEKNDEYFIDYFDVKEIFEKNGIYSVEEADITKEVIDTYINESGDPYAEYFSAEEWDSYESTLAGQAFGIGVLVRNEITKLLVLDVFENSPAYNTGILPGDYLVGVDGTLFNGISYDEMLALIKGAENSTVTINVLRGEEELSFDCTRSSYTVNTVRTRYYTDETLNKKVAIIRITNFYEKTYIDFYNELVECQQQNVDGIIFDVRDNPGGILSVVVTMLDMLLDKGLDIVHINYKNSSKNYTYTSSIDAVISDIPMSVLINSSSASAAELFTSSLKDHNKAIIVGEKSYGKGCGQSMFTLEDGSVLKLTTFLYNPPISDNYNGIGITPDFEVKLSEELSKTSIYLLSPKDDPQISKAIEEMFK